MQTISLHTFNIPAPSNYAELSKRQCKILMACILGKIDKTRLSLLLFQNFLACGMLPSEKWWYLWNIMFLKYFAEKTFFGNFLFNKCNFNITLRSLPNECFIELADSHTEFLFDDKDKITQIKFTRLAGFEACSNSLNNLSFRQFRNAEEFALNYAQTNNETALNTLLAWLFLPKSYYELDATDKRYRAALSPTEVKKRAAKIAKIDIEIRYYLFLWYINAKDALMKRFDKIWVVDDKRRIKTQSPIIRLRDSLTAMLVVRAVHVTQTDDTDFSSLFDVLQFFQNEAKQAEAMKA